jgi:hypothetical protein
VSVCEKHALPWEINCPSESTSCDISTLPSPNSDIIINVSLKQRNDRLLVFVKYSFRVSDRTHAVLIWVLHIFIQIHVRKQKLRQHFVNAVYHSIGSYFSSLKFIPRFGLHDAILETKQTQVCVI